jgi:hypothetical protein
MQYGYGKSSEPAAVPDTKYESALLKLFGNIVDAHMLLAQEEARKLDSSGNTSPQSGILYLWELRDASETLHASVMAARQEWPGEPLELSRLYDEVISLGSRTVADLEELI